VDRSETLSIGNDGGFFSGTAVAHSFKRRRRWRMKRRRRRSG